MRRSLYFRSILFEIFGQVLMYQFQLFYFLLKRNVLSMHHILQTNLKTWTVFLLILLIRLEKWREKRRNEDEIKSVQSSGWDVS